MKLWKLGGRLASGILYRLMRTMLRSIDIFFYRNEEVRKALKVLREEYSKAVDMQKVCNKQLRLIEEIANCLNYNDITWEEISEPYYPQWLIQDDKNTEEFKNIQLETFSCFLKQQEIVLSNLKTQDSKQN